MFQPVLFAVVGGCSVKTRWCNHNDPSYGTSNHGIPCFGARAIYDFFESS